MKTFESGYRSRSKAGLRKMTTAFVPHVGTVAQARLPSTKVDMAALVKKVVGAAKPHVHRAHTAVRKPRLAMAMPCAS